MLDGGFTLCVVTGVWVFGYCSQVLLVDVCFVLVELFGDWFG